MVQLKFQRRFDRHPIVRIQPLMQFRSDHPHRHRAGRNPGLGGQSTIQRRWGRRILGAHKSSFAQNDGQ
jgi:hypothetical protein